MGGGVQMPNFGSVAPTRQEGGDHRETPPELMAFLERTLGPFSCDPCQIHATWNGLEIDWRGVVFVNPPYSDIRPWVLKAIREVENGRAHRVVMLVPAATDTIWWWDAWKAARGVWFLRPRLRFIKDGKRMGSPAFGSALLIFGAPAGVDGWTPPLDVRLVDWRA